MKNRITILILILVSVFVPFFTLFVESETDDFYRGVEGGYSDEHMLQWGWPFAFVQDAQTEMSENFRREMQLNPEYSMDNINIFKYTLNVFLIYCFLYGLIILFRKKS